MTPHRLLKQLKTEGVELRFSDGRLLGPRTMTKAQRETVAANKTGLISILLNQCHICNQPLRLKEYETAFALECPIEPIHYFEEITKKRGARKGLREVLEEAGEFPNEESADDRII